MKKPFVVALILNWNGKLLLQDALSTYLKNDYSNKEIVVVDNGSTDGSKEFVEQYFPEVYVHRTEVNLKYSGGLNFGMEYAFGVKKADYVLITNNDVVADEKMISSLVNTAEKHKDAAFVIGKVYYYDAPGVLQTVGKKYDSVLWNAGHIGNKEKDKGQYDTEEQRAWCDDIYWLVKREIWEKTGGYDTEFAFQGEDFDWQVRAKQLGYKIMYTPKAKLWHKESMTIGKTSAFKAYYDARNPLIIHMKYRKKSEYMSVLKMRLKGNLRSSYRYLLKGRISHLFSIWRGFFSAIAWGLKNKRLP
jgi:GT2 family glycosyltransferase